MREKFVLGCFIILFLGCPGIVIAEVASGQGEDIEALRPKIEWNADDLRDPFEDYITEKPLAQAVQKQEEILVQKEEPVVLPALAVQGIIWGGNKPCAIINNKVIEQGRETAEGVKITNISRQGIELRYKGKKFNLSSPAESAGHTGEKDE